MRRAEVPVEVTAGLLRRKGRALIRFWFTLHGPDLLASPPRATPLCRDGRWDRVLQDFFIACIITLVGKPNIRFVGLGAVLNLLKKIWREPR